MVARKRHEIELLAKAKQLKITPLFWILTVVYYLTTFEKRWIKLRLQNLTNFFKVDHL